MALLQLKSVTVAFGGDPVLDAADLTMEPGERLCLLGRNGSGKSTLLAVTHGSLEPDDGRVIKSAGTRVSLLDQRVPSDFKGSVEEVVISGRGCNPQRPTEPYRARAAISRAGLDPTAEVSTLSAGLKRRVLIASALASEADLMLLDEPTNHLDLESIAWLEGLLLRQETSLLFVTHDRAFLRKIATGILELDRGRLQRHAADYDAFVDRKRAALAAESRNRAQFDKKLAAEEVWIRQGVRERRKRNIGRVARLKDMRGEHGARRNTQGTARITVQAGERTGRLVVETKGLSYAWDGQPIVRDLSTTIMRQDRVGIIGPNGSGKTTLIRLLLGELKPDEGTIRQGTNLQVAYFDQLHAALDETTTLAENVGDGSSTITINGKTRQVIGYLGDFLFTPDQARGSISKLSGGERNRLLLARLFARPSNVLVLDEPTNDLDVETLEVLEDLLVNYEGTVLIVSHDRELLDHVATSVLVLGEYGEVTAHVGGYSEWAKRKRASKDRSGGKSGKRSDKTAKPATAKPAQRLDKGERKELAALPASIEKLESQQASIHATMADPAFFQKPRAEVAKVESRLQTVGEAIAVAYARWELLEAKQAGGDAPA